MKSDFRLEPETEEEIELFDRLSEIREYALDEVGLSREEVSQLFNLYASGVIDESFVGPQLPESPECPSCGRAVVDVEATGLGEQLTVIPCGHLVDSSEVPDSLFLDSE